MHVAAVRAENRLPAEETAADGERDVEDRHEHRHQRRGHAENSGGLEVHGGATSAPNDAKTSEEKSEQQTSRITQENSCRIEVVPQETQQCGGE